MSSLTGEISTGTHTALEVSVRDPQVPEHGRSEYRASLWGSEKDALSPSLALHVCSLTCLRGISEVSQRPPHAPGPPAIRRAPRPGLLGPGSPKPCSPSRIPPEALLWCWARPCYLLPSSCQRLCFWKHCPQLQGKPPVQTGPLHHTLTMHLLSSFHMPCRNSCAQLGPSSCVQACLGDTERSVPGHRSDTRVPVKRLVIFLLKGATKASTIKGDVPILIPAVTTIPVSLI